MSKIINIIYKMFNDKIKKHYFNIAYYEYFKNMNTNNIKMTITKIFNGDIILYI